MLSTGHWTKANRWELTTTTLVVKRRRRDPSPAHLLNIASCPQTRCPKSTVLSVSSWPQVLLAMQQTLCTCTARGCWWCGPPGPTAHACSIQCDAMLLYQLGGGFVEDDGEHALTQTYSLDVSEKIGGLVNLFSPHKGEEQRSLIAGNTLGGCHEVLRCVLCSARCTGPLSLVVG